MKRFLLCFFIILSSSSYNAKGQDSLTETNDVLEKLFDRLVNNYNDTIRVRINDSIYAIVDSYVRYDNVIKHKFSSLRYLGEVTSPDSLIKIVTWNLILANNPGRYYCYIIKNEGTGRKNRIYSLTSGYKESPVKTDTIYTSDDWYGALYYDIRPYIINGKSCWVLLGIDYGNPLISRKIIDVLSFNQDDSILFGMKWFLSGEKLSFREVLEYGSSGMMTLRFASDRSIVFDHLVPFSASQKDDRQFYGPDYSYDAYTFGDGIWKLNVNVDARNKE
jgi:hypothetical protein